MQLLLATQNAGKIKEFGELLKPLPIRLRNLKDFGDIPEPLETETSFAGNAALKARYYALQSGLYALADDSGLEVAALGGAPGVFSARYAGADANDSQRIDKLLSELAAAEDKNRRARFACVIAVADATGAIIQLAEGFCDGKIAFAPRGASGFGYDPVFIPEGFSETFAELSPEKKREISHRARACKKIIAFLRGFIAA